MSLFHPIVQKWFDNKFEAPTPPQKEGWPVIQSRQDVLIAAPTGSGKTLTSFLVCIDQLIKDAIGGKLQDATRVVYISPLKALSNDIRRNLETPLREIRQLAAEEGYNIPPIRAVVRTGDTPQHVRQKMLKEPPHILVTTPESLFLLLTSEKSRNILKRVDTVIVDEIHALARDKRGSHLTLTLERLNALCYQRPLRIGLSATQKPIEEIAKFLVGFGNGGACKIIDSGHKRDLDLEMEVPASELSAVCSHEQWDEVYDRIIELIEQHRSTLIFVNTRKLAERMGRDLGLKIGEKAVMSHHGSLSKEMRLEAEEKLKAGELKAIIATASLELGIDVGYVDLVIQVSSPYSIATFLQRVGRSGHAVGALPKGRLFALNRDELIQSMALIRSVKDGFLDEIEIPHNPLDILSQQIVAATAAEEEWDETELYELFKKAYSYQTLTQKQFDEVVSMLANGYTESRKQFAWIHYDAVNRKIKAKKGARLAALTSSGAIPEQPLYRVVNIDDGTFIGTIDEDFAMESSAGYVFQLGNNSWQLVNIRNTEVQVRDAHGAPPDIPFWLGEAPGRTVELSEAVSKLREEIGDLLELRENDPINGMDSLKEIFEHDPVVYRPARKFLKETVTHNEWAAIQAVHYVAVQKSSLGFVPTQKKVVYERFFDQTGGMQLVVHAPFGMRINKAWGLALRKSFCRSFDFELQAVADNNGVLLSLGNNQSFPIEQLFGFLKPDNVYGLLEQAILQVPLFKTRWQWNATRALAVLRFRAGKKVPPALQRFRGDDLLTESFPDATQCFEHITGDIELPDHPLIQQTMHDCMQEAMDFVRMKEVMQQVKNGEIELIAKETREPSPFSYSLINANPYAFLDDGELPERRTRAIVQRRSFSLDTFSELTKLDKEAIQTVAEQAWPLVRDSDELHEAMEGFCLVDTQKHLEWEDFFQVLKRENRGAEFELNGTKFWTVTERITLIEAAYPKAVWACKPEIPEKLQKEWESAAARATILGGYMEVKPMLTTQKLSDELHIPLNLVEADLLAIEAKGLIIQGYFTQDQEKEWCHRRLLQRIHRLTLEGLRKQIQAVTPQNYLHFLTRYHGMTLDMKRQERQGVYETLMQLEGFETAAGEWEGEILPARIQRYQESWLDELCMQGKITWGRLRRMQRDENGTRHARGMNRIVPLAFMQRSNLGYILPENVHEETLPESIDPKSKDILNILTQKGAQFAPDLEIESKLFASQVEECLGELVRLGCVHADGFSAIRSFVSGEKKKVDHRRKGVRKRYFQDPSYGDGGRWSLFPGALREVQYDERIAYWTMLLLRRYGVIFRDLLERESAAPHWSELVRVFRRLEAQGEVRGGRFVSGVSGEQYALPDVVPQLRAIREENHDDYVVVSAADPVNLVGIITEDPRYGSSRNVRLLLHNGKHVATIDAGEVTFHEEKLQSEVNKLTQALKLGGAYREWVWENN